MAVVPVAAMAAVANFGEGEYNDQVSDGQGSNAKGCVNGDENDKENGNLMNGSGPTATTTTTITKTTNNNNIEATNRNKQKVENKATDRTNSVVRLNVGGIEFVTTAGTLLWCGESSVLHRLANSYLEQVVVSAAPVLDRDPDVFAHLLKYLRSVRFGSGTLPGDPSLRNALIIEARALRIPALEADLQKLRQAESVRRIVICEKHLVYVNGIAVSGHFTIAGRRNSAGWFGSFSEEALTRSFQDRMSQLVAEKASPSRNNNINGLKLSSTVTASAVSSDGAVLDAQKKIESPRLRHIHTVTLTFQAV